MRKKKQNKKRLDVDSEDNSFDASTTSQGYTARGKIHHGGNYMDAECIQSMSTVTSQAVTSHRSASHHSTSHRSACHRSFSDYQAFGISHQAFNHQTPVTCQPGTRHQSTYQARVIIVSLSRSTSHRSSSHRSFSDYQASCISHQAFNHQAPVTSQPVTRHQSTFQAWVIMHHSIGSEFQVANQ